MPFLGPIQQIFAEAPIFIMVLFRLAGLMVLAPLLGSATIPMRVKALTALVLSMAVFPLVGGAAELVAPNSVGGLAVAVAGEMLVGISMGLVLNLAFVGIQLGARLVGQQMGLAFAQLVDPMSDNQVDVLSQFYLLLATVFYVLMNGHLMLIKALANTFRTIPLAGCAGAFMSSQTGGFSHGLIGTLVSVLTASFGLGVRIAGPALAAVYLATLALGFVSRTMPQLNILAAGFPVRIMLALVLLIVSFGSLVVLFGEAITSAFAQIGNLFC